jgi:HD-GYP domain-containing protein (c-di-GMP phosphodiesterase class II)
VPLRAPSIQLGGELGEVPEMTIGGVQALNKRNGQPFSDEDVYLLAKLSGLAATILQFARLYEDTHTLFWGFVNAITSAIDSKDPWMRDHSKRVSDFSVAIAQELPSDWWSDGKLSQQMLYHIRVGSMLHDVGKIRVGDAILNKPDRLTDEEMEEMRKHPRYGVELLDNEAQLGRILNDALPAILEHHERLNGCGYPRGLKGDQISRIGRIVAVADAFEAITSDRPYRQGQSVERALQILLEAAGSEYDSACVQALVRIHEKGLVA